MFNTERTERVSEDAPMGFVEEVKTTSASKEPEGDDEEIPAVKKTKSPATKAADEDEEMEMAPLRRRANKKRRIRRDSSVDEDEADEPMKDM